MAEDVPNYVINVCKFRRRVGELKSLSWENEGKHHRGNRVIEIGIGSRIVTDSGEYQPENHQRFADQKQRLTTPQPERVERPPGRRGSR